MHYFIIVLFLLYGLVMVAAHQSDPKYGLQPEPKPIVEVIEEPVYI